MNVSVIPHKIIRFLALAGICLLLAGLAGCSQGKGKNEQVQKNSTDAESFRADTAQVNVTNIRSKDFSRNIKATGTLNAREKATVRAKVAGEIQRVYVDIGDRVQKGDLLMQIDPTDFQLAFEQAKAQLAQAKATLDNSKREKQRMVGLFKAGSATEQNKDKAVTSYQQDKAGYEEALAAKNKAQQQLDYTSIQAPFSGVVTKRFYKKGDYASAAQPAAQVTNLSVLEAEMDIPERYAGSLDKGLSVELRFQSRIDSTKGKVTAVNPQIDTDSRTFLVKVTVDNGDRTLSDGLFFTASFNLPVLRNKPAVPTQAIQKDEGDDILWIIKNGKAYRRLVQRGAENGNWLMIRQGAKIGETIAIGGTGSLIDGYPVTTKRTDSLSMKN